MSAIPDNPSRPTAEIRAPSAEGQPPEMPAQAPPRPRVQLSPLSIVIFTVVFWIIPLLGLFFARYIDILLVIFLAVLFSTFLTPVVNVLERVHLHRGVSIILVYLAILGAIYVVGRLAAPLFVDETQKLVSQIPTYIHRFEGPLRAIGINLHGGKGFSLKDVIAGYLSGAGHSASGVVGQALGVVLTIGQLSVAVLAIVVLAFLLTVRKTFTADVVNTLVPPAYRARWLGLMTRMGERMGGWVIGQLIITVYYAVAFSVGLFIIHVPNETSIGVITGVLEIIPFVGGIIGGALAVLVAFTVNPTLVIWVILLYLIVTNVEAHVLVPLIYGRAVHVHPFVVIVALLFGGASFGIIGAIIAVPIAAALQVAVKSLYVRDVVEAAERDPSRWGGKWPPVDLRRWPRWRHQGKDRAG